MKELQMAKGKDFPNALFPLRFAALPGAKQTW
jgi:hypothetical protein